MPVLQASDFFTPTRIDSAALSALSQPKPSLVDSILAMVEQKRKREKEDREQALREKEAADRAELNKMNLELSREKINDMKAARQKSNAINSAYGLEMDRLGSAPIGPDDEAYDPVTTPLKIRRDVSMDQGNIDDAVAIQKNLNQIEDMVPKPKHGVEINNKTGEVLGTTIYPDGRQELKVLREGEKPEPKIYQDSYGGFYVPSEDGTGMKTLKNPTFVPNRSGSGGTSGSMRDAREFRQGWNAVSSQRRNVEKILSDLQDPLKSSLIPEPEKTKKTQELQAALTELKDTENYYANRYFESTGRHPSESAGINDTYGPIGGKVPVPTTVPVSTGQKSGRATLERLRKDGGKK